MEAIGILAFVRANFLFLRLFLKNASILLQQYIHYTENYVANALFILDYEKAMHLLNI